LFTLGSFMQKYRSSQIFGLLFSALKLNY
jgi:hypothetical protein